MKKMFRSPMLPAIACLVFLSSCQRDYCATCFGDPQSRCTVSAVLMALIVVCMLLLGHFSNILRDDVNDCDAFNTKLRSMNRKSGKVIKHAKNPYSLAKVQFAAWTVLISCSYLYLLLCKDDSCGNLPMNKTALILMGISAVTAASSVILDKRQIAEDVPRHQNAPSKGFISDILSDEKGVSVHRFQNVVWSVIAMVIYMHKVCSSAHCQLPELDDTLLALTGISSATFLTLKARENDTITKDSSADGGEEEQRPVHNPRPTPAPDNSAGAE